MGSTETTQRLLGTLPGATVLELRRLDIGSENTRVGAAVPGRPNSDNGSKKTRIESLKTWQKQVIVLANAFAFLVHFVMFLLCLTACDSGDQCTEEGMTMTIYRIRANWTSMAVDGYDLIPVDNGKPIRFHVTVSLFFLISAAFHILAVFVGAPGAFFFESNSVVDILELYYWKQIRQAFTPWRWIEYSMSASLMLFVIATLLGLREENTLACLFLLMWCTQMFGLLTELLARPSLDNVADGHRQWANDRESGANCTSWFYAYAVRMFPHVLGFFPYITCWVVVLNYFIASLEDTRKENQDLWDQVPDFVVPAVFGTMAIFTSFTFVQWRYLWISPDFWWRTELWYIALSLTAKLFLGGFLYSNVLRFRSVTEALEQD